MGLRRPYGSYRPDGSRGSGGSYGSGGSCRVDKFTWLGWSGVPSLTNSGYLTILIPFENSFGSY